MGRLSIRTWLLLGSTIACVLAWSAGAVQAATVVEFEPGRGAPGTRVVGTTVGAGMSGFENGRVLMLLAPNQRTANDVAKASDPRLRRFGQMTADEEDVGHFRGRVPHVHPGRYVVVAYCRDCVPGGSLFTVGEFRVTGLPLPATGLVRIDFLLLCAVSIVVSGVLAVSYGR